MEKEIFKKEKIKKEKKKGTVKVEGISIVLNFTPAVNMDLYLFEKESVSFEKCSDVFCDKLVVI